jgi:hypothetical protein
MPPRKIAAPERTSVVASSKESSAQAASARRLRATDAPPWLFTTGSADEGAAYRQRQQEVRYAPPFLDLGTGVPRSRSSTEFRDPALAPLDKWLAQRAAAVTATEVELNLAGRRADAVVAALGRIYPGASVYDTGSIAHGDALSPLNDIDLGVILEKWPDRGTGQDRPLDEMRRAAGELENELKGQFPRLTADWENKRSIVLNFNEPQAPGAEDFTCDVIIARPGPGRDTLLIPNTELEAGWDENAPVFHRELMRRADRTSGGSFSQTVRLVKHWRNGYNPKPLYSWNIKTLAVEAGSESARPFEGLHRFFAYAVHAVAEGPTENPRPDEDAAFRFPPPTVARDRLEVTAMLKAAYVTLEEARTLALIGKTDLAVRKLAELFPSLPAEDGPY